MLCKVRQAWLLPGATAAQLLTMQLTCSAIVQNGQTATDGLYQGPTALSQGARPTLPCVLAASSRLIRLLLCECLTAHGGMFPLMLFDALVVICNMAAIRRCPSLHDISRQGYVSRHKMRVRHPADIVNVIRRIKLLGFTAVRLPFSMQNLVNDTARDFQWTACQNIAQSDIIASVTNPAVGVPKGANAWTRVSLAVPAAACAGRPCRSCLSTAHRRSGH